MSYFVFIIFMNKASKKITMTKTITGVLSD